MKIDRQKVYEKYDRRCAYCGALLTNIKDMQVDDFKPLGRIYEWSKEKRKFVYTGRMHHPENRTFENYMPSCRKCNYYKSDLPIEEFRECLLTLHEKIRTKFLNKVAEDYGIITVKPFDGKFYFERSKE